MTRTPTDPETSTQIREALHSSRALKSGHFLLSSGLHSDAYCQCAALFERPDLAARLASIMQELIAGTIEADTVLAPALGGVCWGYQLASAMGARSLFAEREKGEAFELRRGFDLRPGERVLLAEDVITTGKSVSELVPLVENAGAIVTGYAAVADRSKGSFSPPVPVFALIELDFNVYDPDDVPETLRAIPIEKPGSRSITSAT